MANNLSKELQLLREQDPEVALLLDVFAETDQIYQETLEAAGIASKPEPTLENSAKVTISFSSTSPLTGNKEKSFGQIISTGA